MTNEARAKGARSLCLARRNKGYAQIIDIKVPDCWQQLKDNQLRYVYKLLNGNFSVPQAQTLCLFRWAKMKVKRREGSLFIVKYQKQVFPVSALQITEAIQAMNWLADFPVYPVRLSRIGLHRPLPADFQGVPFGTFLALDNRCVPSTGYWQKNLYVLCNTLCPALLTENLFQDNKADVDFLLSDQGRQPIVNLHLHAIEDYIGGN